MDQGGNSTVLTNHPFPGKLLPFTAGTNTLNSIVWDVINPQWVQGARAAAETGASCKAKYEGSPETHAYNDGNAIFVASMGLVPNLATSLIRGAASMREWAAILRHARYYQELVHAGRSLLPFHLLCCSRIQSHLILLRPYTCPPTHYKHALRTHPCP
jgi:hypothetical protein